MKYLGMLAAPGAVLAYLNLAVMPGFRQCILENRPGLIEAAKSCMSNELLIGGMLLAGLALAAFFFGLRDGHFIRIYSRLENAGKEWVIVAAVTAFATLGYLSQGSYLIGDALNNIALTLMMQESIRTLTYPFWSFYWYMGSAPFAFYGWLYPLISGLLGSIIGTSIANKILMFALHMGSALAMYKLAKFVTKNSKAAIVSALVYALSLEHMGRIMIGRNFTSLTFLLLPLIFLAYEYHIAGRIGTYRAIAVSAAIIALMAFNHPANSAFMLLIFIIYAVLRAVEERSKFRQGAMLIAGFALAFFLTAFWTVPIILEGSEVSQTAKLVDEIIPQLPSAAMAKDMLLWPGIWGGKQIFYLGLSGLALGAFGIYHLRKTGKKAFAWTAIAALLLVIFQTTRYNPVLLLMIAMSAGYGFIFLSRKLKIDARVLMFLLVGLLAVDTFPGLMQAGYVDFGYFGDFYKSINAGPGERVMDLSTDRRTYWDGMVYAFNGQESLFGTLIETAPRSFPYAASIANRAAIEYYDEQVPFSEETLDGLYLLGVKHIILHPEQIGKAPQHVFAEKRTTLGLEREMEAIETENWSPIIASQRLTPAKEGALGRLDGWYMRVPFEKRSIDLEETGNIIAGMEINRLTATSKQIFVFGEEAVLESAPEITVESIRTGMGKVEMDYSASQPAFLQLSYSYSPFLELRIDGNEVAYWKTAINTVAVSTGEGRHTISIEAKQSFLRKILFIVSGLAVAMAIALYFRRPK